MTPGPIRRATVPATRLVAPALGAAALGALAIGAVAIGTMAINGLVVRRARFRSVEIDDLTVRRLRVLEAMPGIQEPTGAEIGPVTPPAPAG
jgi:hypothetical protein